MTGEGEKDGEESAARAYVDVTHARKPRKHDDRRGRSAFFAARRSRFAICQHLIISRCDMGRWVEETSESRYTVIVVR